MVHGAEPDMGLSQRRPCSAAFWIIAESGAADGRRLEMREVSAVAGAWCEKHDGRSRMSPKRTAEPPTEVWLHILPKRR